MVKIYYVGENYLQINPEKDPFLKDSLVEIFLGYGEIYLIRNRWTGQVYIGQTRCIKFNKGKPSYQGYLYRFRKHMSNAFSSNKQTRESCIKLYDSVREYNKASFYVICICRCPVYELNKMERHYIRLYKSKRKGMNCNSGGQFKRWGKRREKKNSKFVPKNLPKKSKKTYGKSSYLSKSKVSKKNFRK